MAAALEGLRARAASDDKLSQAIESYTVRHSAGGLQREAALSLDFVRHMLGRCAGEPGVDDPQAGPRRDLEENAAEEEQEDAER